MTLKIDAFDEIWNELSYIFQEEQLNRVQEEFTDWEEKNQLNENLLFETSNVLGKFMRVEDIDFSFYFSPKNDSPHGIRIKICWNRDKMDESNCGVLELHGDYKYYQSPKIKNIPDSVDIATARYFGKKYKVLFAAVWEKKLDMSILQMYFTKNLSWKEILSEFQDISEEEFFKISHCKDLKELESCIRENKIFNLND